MLTFEQAKNLSLGTTLYHRDNRNADGTPQRWRVNGKVKLWKLSPEHIKIPLKHGLRNHDYLTEDDLCLFFLDEQEALQKPAFL